MKIKGVKKAREVREGGLHIEMSKTGNGDGAAEEEKTKGQGEAEHSIWQ